MQRLYNIKFIKHDWSCVIHFIHYDNVRAVHKNRLAQYALRVSYHDVYKTQHTSAHFVLFDLFNNIVMSPIKFVIHIVI